MGNGSQHPDEKEFAKRVGDNYIVDELPEGARLVGKDELMGAKKKVATSDSTSNQPTAEESCSSDDPKST